MLGIAEQLAHRRVFDDLPAIHDYHPIGDAGNDAEIMGDPDHRHAELLAKLFHQLDDLRLNGHIKRRGRLVSDQNLGIASQGNRDHHPLPHPAGKLVRIV